MSNKICIVDGCENDQKSKKLCQKHYARSIRYGDPLGQPKKRPNHGMRDNPEYKVWKGLNDRCRNKNHKLYHRYGGRGIVVCNRWVCSFVNFFNDIGPRPTPKHQIDRIDNDGNYEPKNCRWVTREENVQNSSSAKLKINDVKKIRNLYGKYNYREIGEMFGVTKTTIIDIVKRRTWKNV